MRLVCEKISSHRFMATRHLWLYDGNKMGKTSSHFGFPIAWTKSYPPTLDNQKAWVNMWNNCFQTHQAAQDYNPEGRETNKLSLKTVLAFCLEAHSRLQRGQGILSRAQMLPWAEKTDDWRSGSLKQLKAAAQTSGGEREKKSSKNMQRINESLLNINICMYKAKLQEAREMTQELWKELMCG